MSRKETNFSGQRLSEENKKKLMKKWIWQEIL